MKYATYNEYKPSNISWIRDFPAHWELKRLKWIANRAEVKVEADEYNPLPYIGLEQVESWTGRLINLDEELVPTGVSNRFSAGDTLFGKLRPYLAKACNVDFDGLCSSELLVLRGKTYDRKFLLYQLLSHGFINLVDSSTYGSKMPRASWDFIGICELPLPPIDEQQTIARFLDAKTAQIDALVAQNRQLIDKLKEKRQALIARTVTRGLPPEAAKAAGLEPNPKMENAEEGWIGEMPVHWKAKKGSHLGRLIGSVAPAEDDITEDDDGVPYAKVDDLNFLDSSLRLTSTKVRLKCAPPRWNTIILFPKRGAAIFTNKVALAQQVTFDSNLMGWEIYKDSDPKFVAYCLIARRLDDLADVSTVPQINNKHIYPAKFPHPPRCEQEAIVAFLDSETTRIDRLVGHVEGAISRLTEYRQALITFAVTGKIDARGLA
ncbi:restriction endonuclease subunit S [Comamonas testosteroni]|uniref:restriction endonuclease subunit S n=1 Tax=Comamonas testosteroni TaxID=285 RepID=UPI00391B384C